MADAAYDLYKAAHKAAYHDDLSESDTEDDVTYIPWCGLGTKSLPVHPAHYHRWVQQHKMSDDAIEKDDENFCIRDGFPQFYKGKLSSGACGSSIFHEVCEADLDDDDRFRRNLIRRAINLELDSKPPEEKEDTLFAFIITDLNAEPQLQHAVFALVHMLALGPIVQVHHHGGDLVC